MILAFWAAYYARWWNSALHTSHGKPRREESLRESVYVLLNVPLTTGGPTHMLTAGSNGRWSS